MYFVSFSHKTRWKYLLLQRTTITSSPYMTVTNIVEQWHKSERSHFPGQIRTENPVRIEKLERITFFKLKFTNVLVIAIFRYCTFFKLILEIWYANVRYFCGFTFTFFYYKRNGYLRIYCLEKLMPPWHIRIAYNENPTHPAFICLKKYL